MSRDKGPEVHRFPKVTLSHWAAEPKNPDRSEASCDSQVINCRQGEPPRTVSGVTLGLSSLQEGKR